MIINTFLSLGDSGSSLLLEDGTSFLLLGSVEIAEPITPIKNTTTALDIENGFTYLVTDILRFNKSPNRPYQYACSLRNLSNNKNGAGDVWYDIKQNLWYCMTYNRVHYKDNNIVR